MLRELYSHEVPVPRTGKRGRPSNSKNEVDDDLNYGTVKKTREKGHIVKVERTIVFGTEASVKTFLEKSPSNTINTSFVERSNLNWRLWDAHLTRKTVTFAKSLRWLKAKLAICVIWYNFVRPHGTLTKNTNNNEKVTPAMAAGIAHKPWTVSDIVKGLPIIN